MQADDIGSAEENREEFEGEFGQVLDLTMRLSGEYVDPVAQQAWVTWRDAERSLIWRAPSLSPEPAALYPSPGLPSMPTTIIAQVESSYEVRSVLHAAVMAPAPIRVWRSTAEDLEANHGPLLRSVGTLPVGSVEFVREAMRIVGIPEPEPLSYPPELEKYMGREFRQVTAGLARAGLKLGLGPGEVAGRFFVKPVRTKLFTGFVFDAARPALVGADDWMERSAFIALPDSELVWVSEIVDLVCEWRFYVSGRQILGQARYDPYGEDSAPAPDRQIVLSMVEDLHHNRPVAIDVGVTRQGKTIFIEGNDAWAIGLYDRALTHEQYTQFLFERWQQLHTADVNCHGDAPLSIEKQ